MFEGIPRRTFSAIVADPPWKFKSWTAPQVNNPEGRRDVERHYDTMSIDKICALPVGDLSTKDAHLFLWATGPCLPDAFKVIEAWGFRYSSMGFVWIKLKKKHDPLQLRFLPAAEFDLHVGLGLTTRHNAEFCLLARKGSARRMARDIREVIMEPVREHSRKPEEAYLRVMRYCEGPYLELFSREQRPGWICWGNESLKFTNGAT
jgi:N6-adenosine-specific RNA methylase IME4